MDILYSVGPNSTNNWQELRWSLRSIDMYGKNVGKVVVCGTCPDWLSDNVVKMPIKPFKEGGCKHDNILDAILQVAESGIFKGEFLYSSDDHFLVKTVDFNRYPYFYRRPRLRSIQDLVNDKAEPTKYRIGLADTRRMLELEGFPAIEFNGHVNTHMHVADAPTVHYLWEKHRDEVMFGFEPTCLFMNVRMKLRNDFPRPVFRKDLKVKEIVPDKKYLMSRIEDRDTFSIGDGGFQEGSKLWEVLDSMYPPKCKYEL